MIVVHEAARTDRVSVRHDSDQDSGQRDPYIVFRKAEPLQQETGVKTWMHGEEATKGWAGSQEQSRIQRGARHSDAVQGRGLLLTRRIYNVA